MLGRLKFDISEMVNEILDHLPHEIWSSNCTKFLDPSMGGGQFVAEIEKRLSAAGHTAENIASRVYGYELNLMRINYAVNKYKLVGTYKNKDFLNEDIVMKFDVIVGNPPYTDGTAGKTNIWQKFVTSQVAADADYCCWITPSSFLQSNQNPMPEVRSFLKDSGLKVIKVLGLNAFATASVRTVYVFCDKKHKGKTKIIDKAGSYEIEFDSDPIVLGGSEIGTNLIKRVQTDTKYTLKKTRSTPLAKKIKSFSASGDVQFLENLSTKDIYGQVGYVSKSENIDYTDSDQIRLVIGYLPSGTNYAKSFGTMNIIMPGIIVPSYYRYFVCKTVDEALQLKEYLESKFVTFIQSHARSSQTLDNPQVQFIPFNKDFSLDLSVYFDLTQEEIDYIESTVK